MTLHPERTRKDVLLDRLYGLLTELGIHADDVVAQLRRDRVRVKSLGELDVERIEGMVADCERLIEARSAR